MTFKLTKPLFWRATRYYVLTQTCLTSSNMLTWLFQIDLVWDLLPFFVFKTWFLRKLECIEEHTREILCSCPDLLNEESISRGYQRWSSFLSLNKCCFITSRSLLFVHIAKASFIPRGLPFNNDSIQHLNPHVKILNFRGQVFCHSFNF